MKTLITIATLTTILTGCANNQMMQGLAQAQYFARGNAPQMSDSSPGVMRGNPNFNLYTPAKMAPNTPMVTCTRNGNTVYCN